MNNIDLMNYWIKSANEDYKVMNVLYKNNKNSYCLFFGHLIIEKLLKALYAKNNKGAPHAPKTHSLLFLAEKCNLEISEEQVKKLKVIDTFNIGARYDDYKNSFNKKCTIKYTSEQIRNIKEVRKWLKELLIEE